MEDGLRAELTVKLEPSCVWVGSHGALKSPPPGGTITNKKGNTMATKKVPATIAEVRAWGRDNGFTVAAKGRLSAELTTAFTKATKRTIATPATV